MKKYLGLFIIFALLFGFNLAKAEESSPSGAVPTLYRGKLQTETIEEKAKEAREESRARIEATRAEAKARMEKAKEMAEAKREQLKEKNEALREKAKTKMEELRSKVKDAAQGKRVELREGLLVRFDAQVEKVVKFRTRVNELIVKLEADGKDTSEAKSHVANADLKLEEARGKIAEIHSLVSASVNELTKENKTKLQTLSKEAGLALRESYKELHLATQSLKALAKAQVETNTAVETSTETSTQ